MRTLPLFFIVLVSVSVLTGEILSKDFFKYLILIQKTFPDFINNDYYPVAWSLSIEEFFYILFPVILINLNKNKKGLILKKNSEIIDLIKNNINNNDYLMIKGSNSTGLNKITNNIKTGKIYAL